MATHLAFERKREAFGVAMTHTKTVVNSPASRIRPSANGTSCNGMGARPSPQSPASIRTTTSSVPGLPWIVMTSVLCCSRSVENRPGMPSTWSKWPCVSKSRSSLLKPAPLRSNWRCVPSPQSTMTRRPPASSRRPGWLRSADGTLAEVPRKVRSNMIGCMPHPFGRAGCHGAGVQAYYISGERLPDRSSARPTLKRPRRDRLGNRFWTP